MEIEEIKKYVSYEEGGKLLELSPRTIRVYKKEMKDSGLIGTLYPREVLIDCGKIVRLTRRRQRNKGGV
ncbi:MAG: hypothetical protein E7F64_06275 [Clostridiales bacterium]|nr:hypothetical protein [Clostridiales bacterium]